MCVWVAGLQGLQKVTWVAIFLKSESLYYIQWSDEFWGYFYEGVCFWVSQGNKSLKHFKPDLILDSKVVFELIRL